MKPFSAPTAARGLSPLRTVFLISALLLAGCVAPVSSEQVTAEVARVGYGAPPAEGWQDAIKAFMELRLKDSTSAIYKFGEPYQGYLTNSMFDGGGLKAAGYIVQVEINAKNSYGGYTGFQSHRFMIRDNRVLAYATYLEAMDAWSWQ